MNVRASEQGIEKARAVLNDKGWRESKLLEIMSSQQRTKFFNGEPIACSTATKIGSFLGLKWEKEDLIPVKPKKRKQDNSADLDELVREVRSQAYPDSKDGTKHPCKTMRMLRVNHPVPVDGIYVKLNVLNRISSDFSFSDWQRNIQSNPSNFDRWGLATVNQPQVSALSMVQKSLRLMVLGKPGSGKTTFLKSLLVECVEGRLRWNQQDYVPIFITLKDFARASQKQLQPNLSNYIYQEFCSWGLRNSLKDRQVVEKILAEGRALILLDGLDEVPEQVDEKSQELDQESVINEIVNFSKSNNRIVITCRISQKYMWEGFTDVEIADFEKEEREEFVKKWFAVVNGNAESDKLAEELILQLREAENQKIAELAVTPILLNLICIRFRDGDGKLPKNRADFYEDGVTILLKEWDATKPTKGVKRRTVHNFLKGIDDKKRLLAKVAAILFEQNDYFPKQEKLKQLIAKELDISPSEAEEVIKSFEEQSGLLVERCKGFWSFSHLTFHEYFTAKWFCDQADWEGLSNHVSKISWRELFLLAIERIPNANELIQFMKQRIDELAAENVAIQKFLIWLDQKSTLVNLPYKRAAVRAFYFIGSPDNTQGPELAGILDPTINQTFDFTFDWHLTGVLEQASRLDPDLTLEQAFRLDRIPNLNLEPRFTFTYLYSLDPDVIYAHAHGTFETLDRAIIYALHQDLNPQLKQLLQQLQKLKDEFLELTNDKEKFKEWLQSKGKAWIDQLRNVIIQYRNIGHDWQLKPQENKVLQEYYYANLLLVKCLNRSCQVSPKVQNKIEETLLLPIAESKEHQQQMQIADVADKITCEFE